MSQIDRLYPLCALAMAAPQVDRLANTGMVPYDEFALLIQSTLTLSAETTLDIYGGDIEGLRPGSKILREMLGRSGNRKYPDVIRYFISLAQVERQLNQRPGVKHASRPS